MPIPTSLIVVLLVVAWLAVLVPMVARRREHVPEAEEDGVRFRVLRRATASIKRRRPGHRTEIDDAEDDPGEDEEEMGDLDEELLDDPDADIDEDEEFAAEPEPVRRAAPARSPVAAGVRAPNLPAEPGFETAPTVESAPSHAVRPAAEVASAGAGLQPPPAAPFRGRDRGFDGPDERSEQPVIAPDDDRYRPVPQRRGRGGYDPEAAEATRAYRYKRRRRITLFLLLVTVAFSVAAKLVLPILWAGTGVAALLLVAYLAYLRRQVRIEEDIRQRRLAKLRQARQMRPEYHPTRSAAAVNAAAAASSVHTHRGRVLEVDDDDPSFDDLEYYQPVAYRRASGQ